MLSERGEERRRSTERERNELIKSGIFVRYDFNDNFDWFNNYNFSDFAIISDMWAHSFGMYACARLRFPRDCNRTVSKFGLALLFFIEGAKRKFPPIHSQRAKNAHAHKRTIDMRIAHTMCACGCMRWFNRCIAAFVHFCIAKYVWWTITTNELSVSCIFGWAEAVNDWVSLCRSCECV